MRLSRYVDSKLGIPQKTMDNTACKKIECQGGIITGGGCTEEIKARIVNAKSEFGKSEELLNKVIGLELKKRGR